MNTTNRMPRGPWDKRAAVSSLSWAALTALCIGVVWLPVSWLPVMHAADAPFQFALLGDRTGDTQPGVYEEAWREAVAEHPAFVLTVGDTIQGGSDETVDDEWHRVIDTLAPFRAFKLFLTPGNHDVWSPASARAYEKYSEHPLHYSFDWQQAHFTVLNDSQSDNFSTEEMEFLEKDLAAHQAQPVKFILSHRPAWLFRVVLRDSSFPLHKLARKYGVQYVIAGHIHQMIRLEMDGILYLSVASSGGHLRNDKSYAHGWFFQHTVVHVSGTSVTMQIKELKAPFGMGRVTSLSDWGAAGLMSELVH